MGLEDLFVSFENEDSSLYDFQQRLLTKDRKIVLNKTITDDTIEDICMWIFMWNEQDKDIPMDKRKKIFLYINTDGGDAVVGGMILSAIKASITPVVTVGLGKCSSMGSYILAAGHERYCFANTILLVHDGETGYVASGNKGRDMQKFFDRVDERQQRFLIECSNLTQEFLEQNKDRELYLFAEEMKEYGLVDYIVGVDCSLDVVI